MQAVGVVNALPLSNSESLSTLFVEGYPNKKQQLVEERGITQNYLSAMQTPLTRGTRLFRTKTPRNIGWWQS